MRQYHEYATPGAPLNVDLKLSSVEADLRSLSQVEIQDIIQPPQVISIDDKASWRVIVYTSTLIGRSIVLSALYRPSIDSRDSRYHSQLRAVRWLSCGSLRH